MLETQEGHLVRRVVAFACLGLVFAWGGNLAFPPVVGAAGALPGGAFKFFRDLPKASDLDMMTVNGSPLSLEDLKGKVVLLNFWRQHCQYCAMEKRLLRKLVHNLGNPGLKILCVNLWDNPNWIRRYAEKDASDFLFATRNGETASVMENMVKGRVLGYYIVNAAKEAVYEIKGFPTTYVIDKDGRVVAAHMGLARWDNPSIVKWLSGLVGTATRTEPAPEREYSLPAGLDDLITVDLSKKGAWDRGTAHTGESVSAQ